MASDFVVLPCDLVTDLEAQEVAKMWMVDQAGFDADMGRRGRRNTTVREDDGGRRGGFGIWYETKGVDGSVKGQGGPRSLIPCFLTGICAKHQQRQISWRSIRRLKRHPASRPNHQAPLIRFFSISPPRTPSLIPRLHFAEALSGSIQNSSYSRPAAIAESTSSHSGYSSLSTGTQG